MKKLTAIIITLLFSFTVVFVTSAFVSHSFTKELPTEELAGKSISKQKHTPPLFTQEEEAEALRQYLLLTDDERAEVSPKFQYCMKLVNDILINPGASKENKEAAKQFLKKVRELYFKAESVKFLTKAQDIVFFMKVKAITDPYYERYNKKKSFKEKPLLIPTVRDVMEKKILEAQQLADDISKKITASRAKRVAARKFITQLDRLSRIYNAKKGSQSKRELDKIIKEAYKLSNDYYEKNGKTPLI